jgi:DNA-binding Lrp family transcriptional regulator
MVGKQTLDGSDATILEYLQKRGSANDFTDEDRKAIGLSRDSIYERTKKMEKFGIIRLNQTTIVFDRIIDIQTHKSPSEGAVQATTKRDPASIDDIGAHWPLTTEPYTAMVFVQLPNESALIPLQAHICSTPEFAACWEIDGEYDLLIHAIASTQTQLNTILQKMRASFGVRTNKFSVWNAIKPFEQYPIGALRKKKSVGEN